jgi:hypothetical protein
MKREAILAEDWWQLAVTATAQGEPEPPAMEIARAWRKFGDTTASSLLAFRKEVRDCKAVLAWQEMQRSDPVGQFEYRYGTREEISRAFYNAIDDVQEYRKRMVYLNDLKRRQREAGESVMRNSRNSPDGLAVVVAPPEVAATVCPGRVGSASG